MDSLQHSINSLTHHLQDFAANSATSAVPSPSALPDALAAPWPLPPAFTLANALPGLSLGRAYTPMHAKISPRICTKILQGQLINFVSLILPSPEVDYRVASSEDFTLFKPPHSSKNQFSIFFNSQIFSLVAFPKGFSWRASLTYPQSCFR
ncbi:hypothetical protein ILYODFUR_037029 [Ilyodon furcidens]|uniref:Uncharacterized protein n=1 Tax=Ilyodon furcidens TaxID=33524 RepID=A0ABV0VKX2_9TELE